MSILALQQRLVEVGRIRMGEKRTSQGGKTYPAKLGTWRLTSPDKQRLDAVAAVYGGEVKAWEDQHEVITTSDALDIALIPGQALSQHMELWGQEGPRKPVICMRRCDGERELLLDRPCPCKIEAGDDGDLACKPTTHLMVMLRQVPGIGSWRLSTRGWYAAQELLGTAGLLEQLTARGQLVPARLRLDQRTVTKADGNKNFVVPVIDIDVALDAVLGGMALGVGGTRVIGSPPLPELEPAKSVPFTPVPVDELPPPPSTSTREQLAVVAPAGKRRSNAAEPIKPTGLKPKGGGVDGTESASGIAEDAPAPSTTTGIDAGGDEDGVATATPPASDVETLNDEGAQALGRKCADAGIGDDTRAAFLHAFSAGRYMRAHDVPTDDFGDIVKLLHRVRRGDVVLWVDPDGEKHPQLRERADDSTDSPESPAGPPPASIGWKALLGQVKGIGEVKLLRKARELAGGHDIEPTTITSLDAIPAELNEDLRGWLNEQAAA